MKISTKGRYSLRAMIDIARYGSEKPVRLAEMSKRTRISRNYLVKLFQELKRNGLVESIQGRSGGFVLNRPAAEITVRDILLAAEENIIPVLCFGCKEDGKGVCELAGDCTASDYWNDFKKYIEEFLRRTTLEDLSARVKSKLSART